MLCLLAVATSFISNTNRIPPREEAEQHKQQQEVLIISPTTLKAHHHFPSANYGNRSGGNSSLTFTSQLAFFYSVILFLSSLCCTAVPVPVRRLKRHILIKTVATEDTTISTNMPSNNGAEKGGKPPSSVEVDDSKEEDPPSKKWHEFAVKYLNEFGHLSTISPSPREFKAALESFQHMIGHASTGVLDEETVEMMTQPRCGNNDVFKGTRDRRKRFVYISRWENKMDENNVMRLKWYLDNYTSDIPKAEIKKIVERAFNLWSSQVKIQTVESLQLVFEEAPTAAEADITIMWAVGDHGDSHKFDGPGEDGSNILAHTFYPNYQLKGSLNGDIHFDDYEQWNVDGSKEGASFPHVLVHEIGHTLGLGHSKKQQAIMFPIYRKEHLDLMQLDLDDKCAVNWSYIGASDLCLYIWLLSEVVPKKVSMEKDRDHNATPPFMLDSNRIALESSPTKKTALIERLRKTTIPTCNGGNNRVKAHLENMLVRRLSFPRELARDYSEVVCRFLDGLQKSYDIPATDNFHRTFRVDGAHNYFQGEDRFEGLERALANERTFDASFFDQILEQFVSGKEEVV